jgi:hypothetical protein
MTPDSQLPSQQAPVSGERSSRKTKEETQNETTPGTGHCHSLRAAQRGSVRKTGRVMGLDDFDDQYRVVLDFGPDFKAGGSRPALAKMLGMTVKEEVKQAPSTDSESRI